MSFRQPDPNLFLREFERKFNDVKSLILKVGIPKEAEIETVPASERKDSLREIKKEEQRQHRERLARVLLNATIKKVSETEEIYVADIAFKNNFGSFKDKIPARPFGSTLIPRYQEKIRKAFKKEILAYLEKKQDLESMYNRLGLLVSGYMKDNLTNGQWAPNSKLTVFLKGSSKPLIDTGQMRQAITYVVGEED